VWVNPASTARLLGFVGSGGYASSNATVRASYKSNGAISFAWDESRDYLVSAKYVGVVTRTLLASFQAQFARGLIPQLAATSGLVAAIAGSPRTDLLYAVSGPRPPLPARRCCWGGVLAARWGQRGGCCCGNSTPPHAPAGAGPPPLPRAACSP
jgi:hypothetical protein